MFSCRATLQYFLILNICHLSCLCTQVITTRILSADTYQWIHACYFELFFNMSTVFTNLFGILVVTIDRHLYVHWPLHYYNIVTSQRAIIAIIVTWLYTFCQNGFALIFASSLVSGMPCRWSVVLYYDVYFYYIVMVFYIISALVILLYLHIGITVQKLNKITAQLTIR